MVSTALTDSTSTTKTMTSVVFVMTGATATYGGIAAANLNTLHALLKLTSDRDLGLQIFCLNETDTDRPRFLPPEIIFRAFSGDKIRFSLALMRSFSRDTLYVFDHVRLALPLLPFLALGQGACVISAHGSESWRRVRATSRWLFRRARLCLANSAFTLNRMHQKFDGFNGVDCLLGLSPEHELSEHAPVRSSIPIKLRSEDGKERIVGDRMMLLVGRMNSKEGEKGHIQLLHVWQAILKSWPTAQLVFAGPGDARDDLSALARQLGVEASVFIPGFQSVEKLQDLYRACYAFVMPSRQEGFGLVYLEAMNQAKPCIGCWDNGSEDVIVDGETGLLVHDPDNRIELQNALGRLLSSESGAERMGLQGWKRLHDKFTSRHAQKRVIDRLTPLL
jgi:phosphatidylinositol alpha-1,6-mannosyltransferase